MSMINGNIMDLYCGEGVESFLFYFFIEFIEVK